MEYAKKRRRRRDRKGAGSFFYAIVIICLGVYLLTASAAGKWLAENVVAPVFSALDSSPLLSSPNEEIALSDNGVSLSLDDSPRARNVELSIPAMECFSVQMGAFSSVENAHALAAELKSKGAGGYVYDDGNVYRVLASGYSTESEAKEERNRLKGEGLDCTLFELSSPGASLSVTAKEAQIEQLETGFKALYEAQKALYSACISFDHGGMTAEEGAAVVCSIRDELAEACEPLKQYAESSDAVSSLSSRCDKCVSSLTDLANSHESDTKAFSSGMKYVLLEICGGEQ